MSQAYSFFRRHADGRYSDRTLMRLIRTKEALEAGDTRGFPVIITAGSEPSYDEETEEKRGGLVGMTVCWPDDEGRTILAVSRTNRRKLIGGTMLRMMGECSEGLHLWVGRHNTTAQRFLLSHGYFPTSVSAGGGLRYATTVLTDDDEAVAQPERPRAFRDRTMPAAEMLRALDVEVVRG